MSRWQKKKANNFIITPVEKDFNLNELNTTCSDIEMPYTPQLNSFGMLLNKLLKLEKFSLSFIN